MSDQEKIEKALTETLLNWGFGREQVLLSTLAEKNIFMHYNCNI